MKRLAPTIVTILLCCSACNTSKSPLFSKMSPHEKYGNSLKSAGLTSTVLAKEWMESANLSLHQPATIEIPFMETGYFAAEKPAASGYKFAVKRGEKIHVSIATKKDSGALVFAELYRIKEGGRQMLQAFGQIEDTLQQTVKQDGDYLIRIQPELLVSMEYTIKISSGPSLAFPVDSSGKPRFISYWGAGRDAGARKHEGVDIQAAFRTPALAAADGFIFRVGDNRLGGKIVFLRDDETGNSLYYAHLDSQIARTGQRVRIGDTLGLVGKTGNAKNTVPHLHFGIYTGGGAINPFPFINPKVHEPLPVTATKDYLNKWVRVLRATSIYASTDRKGEKLQQLEKGEIIKTVAATRDLYRIETATGLSGYIPSSGVTDKPSQTQTADCTIIVYTAPQSSSVPKASIPAGNDVKVLGKHGDYLLMEANGITGWVPVN